MSDRATATPEPRRPDLCWHQALAYALLGRIEPGLGTQDRPDPNALFAELSGWYPTGRPGLLEAIAGARTDAARWPYVVPDELRSGLGPAQFAAALAEMRRILGVESGPHRVPTDRRLDAAEQALLREVPPHHGG